MRIPFTTSFQLLSFSVAVIAVFAIGLFSGCMERQYQPAKWRPAPRVDKEKDAGAASNAAADRRSLPHVTDWTAVSDGRSSIGSRGSALGSRGSSLGSRGSSLGSRGSSLGLRGRRESLNTSRGSSMPLRGSQLRGSQLRGSRGSTLSGRRGSSLPGRSSGTSRDRFQRQEMAPRRGSSTPLRSNRSRSRGSTLSGRTENGSFQKASLTIEQYPHTDSTSAETLRDSNALNSLSQPTNGETLNAEVASPGNPLRSGRDN